MKIQITATEKAIEIANMFIAQAIKEFESKPHLLQDWGITRKQLDQVKDFRKSMLKSFTGRDVITT